MLSLSLSCVKVLIQFGAEVDLQDSKGQTPLYLALEAGHTDCVQLLLKTHPSLSLLTTVRLHYLLLSFFFLIRCQLL